MTREFRTLEEFGRRFGPEAGEAVAVFDLTLKRVATIHVSAGVQIRIPRRTGALGDSMQVQMPTRDGFGRVTLSAPYAQAVNIGRKRSKPYRRKTFRGGTSVEFTRMLGSKQPQARRGMTRGAFRQLRREWQDVVTEAAQRAEGAA